MTSEHVINLLGGLALFIFGMTFMSDGLKKLAGDYMKTILEKLTEKRIMAVLLGAGLTALIQSSNAMCVMTVGFVNAGMMQLERSVGIIMGLSSVQRSPDSFLQPIIFQNMLRLLPLWALLS